MQQPESPVEGSTGGVVEVVKAHRSNVNYYMAEHHYSHKLVMRCKTLGYFVRADGDIVGGILWAIPPFLKMAGLFGYKGRLDKWEVLMLSRMYLAPEAREFGITPSWFLAETLGRSGRKAHSHKRGWRLQEDWVREWPPVFPDNPFVPRLLMSYSDAGLAYVKQCHVCGEEHNGHHSGTIYAASGWTQFSETHNQSFRMGRGKYSAPRDASIAKACWIMRLPENPRAHALGLQLHAEHNASVLAH